MGKVRDIIAFVIDKYGICAIEISTPTKLYVEEKEEALLEVLDYTVFAFKYSNINNKLYIRCKESINGTEETEPES